MKAAVLEQLNEPLVIRDLEDSQPSTLNYGQVRVRVLVAGICGAQLQEIRGDKGDPAHLPHLLGHEGCGIVERTGEGVKHVKTGEKVVIHWRKGSGCDVSGPRGAGPCTTFSEFAIISENRCTPVPQDFPDDLACLLGCSLSTALGVIENEARIKFGESVMIVGCGGVGLALILAARLAHAHPIIAVDIADKLEITESLGAEFYLGDAQPYEGFDVAIDTTGTTDGIQQGLNDLGPSGRMIMVGQPVSSFINLTSSFFLGNGKSISATQGGCFSPSTDIPRYINLWRSGALDGWENLITHRVSLDDINKGIDLVRKGKAGRVLVDMNLDTPSREAMEYSILRSHGRNRMSGGLSGGNEVADVIQSQPLTHSILST